jgi:hypothetical protein
MSRPRILGWWAVGLLLVCVAATGLTVARACPFCSATAMTFSEEIKASDAVVIVRLLERVKAPPAIDGNFDGSPFAPADAKKSRFEIVQVMKWPKELPAVKQIEVLYFGDNPVDTQFLIFGTDPKSIAWSTPTALTERSVKYISQLTKLPEAGGDRLFFFQDYFEDKDPLLATDSYDEFAKAPYKEVSELKDRMQHDKLLAWIEDPEISPSHRRLYLTMLGVCGKPTDLPILEAMMKSDDRRVKTALDATVACYINLKGPEALPLVEDLFLKNEKSEWVDTYAAIMALRFHGQETNVVPRARLAASLRLMLDRPQLADLVIPDLARWQDWSAMEKVVKLFKDAKEDTLWVRVPVINYLRHCPDPKAKQYVEELRAIDPARVKQAEQFLPIVSTTVAQDAAPDPSATAPAPPPRPKKPTKKESPASVAAPEEAPAKAAPATKTAPKEPVAAPSSEESASIGNSALKPEAAKDVAQKSLSATNAKSSKSAATASAAGVWMAAIAAGAFLLLVFLLIFRSSHKPINV